VLGPDCFVEVAFVLLISKTSSAVGGFCETNYRKLEDLFYGRERTSFYPSHQVGSMHLHGQFLDSDVVSNLFVQPTGGDLDYDLTLGNARQQEARAVPVRQTRFFRKLLGRDGFRAL
jgi:hypothetical protein